MLEEQQEPRGPETPDGEASWSGIELCLEKSEANPEASPGFELRSSELGPEALPPVDGVESRSSERGAPSDLPPEKMPRKWARVGKSRSSQPGEEETDDEEPNPDPPEDLSGEIEPLRGPSGETLPQTVLGEMGG